MMLAAAGAATPPGRPAAHRGAFGEVGCLRVGQAANAVALAGHCRSAAVALQNHTLHCVRVWNVEEAALAARKAGAPHDAPVHCAEFSPDGARVIFGSADGTVSTWNFQTGEQEVRLGGHQGAVLGIRAGALLDTATFCAVSCGRDGTLRLWRLPAGAEARAAPASPAQDLRAALHASGALNRQLRRRLAEAEGCGPEFAS
ncbi:unnamed protein product, partial [Prorocentrum cordatum]